MQGAADVRLQCSRQGLPLLGSGRARLCLCPFLCGAALLEEPPPARQ